MNDGILNIIAGIIILYLSVNNLIEKYKDKTPNGKEALIIMVFMGLGFLVIGLISYFNN